MEILWTLLIVAIVGLVLLLEGENCYGRHDF